MHILGITAIVGFLAWFLNRNTPKTAPVSEPTSLNAANNNPYDLLTIPYNIPASLNGNVPFEAGTLPASVASAVGAAPSGTPGATPPILPSDVHDAATAATVAPCVARALRGKCQPTNAIGSRNADPITGGCLAPSRSAQVNNVPSHVALEQWASSINGVWTTNQGTTGNILDFDNDVNG